jgi:hypothetical protein
MPQAEFHHVSIISFYYRYTFILQMTTSAL